jgi:hypothetical protein
MTSAAERSKAVWGEEHSSTQLEMGLLKNWTSHDEQKHLVASLLRVSLGFVLEMECIKSFGCSFLFVLLNNYQQPPSHLGDSGP